MRVYSSRFLIWKDMTEDSLFEFVVLRNPESPQYLLKTILTQRRITVASDSINFYYPFKELYNRYNRGSYGEKMWGIGFRKKKVDDWICGNHLNIQNASSGDLRWRKVLTPTIDLSGFDLKNNDFFLVLPNDKAMKELCFGDKIPGTKYYCWRCKGVNIVYCKGKTDKEINAYLNEGYRFAYRNNIDVVEKELFPTHQLIPQPSVLSLF